ncbi:MAG: S-methyl-5-thioribose-1-phosphate isomerase [Spirochaetia bacterium]
MRSIDAVEFKDGRLRLIDQRKLPQKYTIFECSTYQECEFAIRDMVVRGAPAIGAAAAYGVVLAAAQFKDERAEQFQGSMESALEMLNSARPTAVNLMWAIERMRGVLQEQYGASNEVQYRALKEAADTILQQDIQKSEAMSAHGNKLVPQGAVILTHCNTGSLAVPGPGTALGVVRAAYQAGKDIFVYADETRPRLQGARLTAWELLEEGIPSKLIADSVAATLMRDGKIDLIVVGADRIAANGDTANKIGTFMLSVVAQRYQVPFYVVAPVSTIDFKCPSGKEIQIEERSSREVTHIEGVQVAPDRVEVYNPAFDVSPAENITAIVTEQGVLYPPYTEAIAGLKR